MRRNQESSPVLGLALTTLLVPLLAYAAPGQPGSAASTVDYARQVQPLLASRCLACHGPKLQKNGLRLDSKRRAFDGGDSGAAILPGKSAESELIRRITSPDPQKRMPPGQPLSLAEKALLTAWVDQGAVWAETPNSKLQTPKTGAQSAIRNPQSAMDWWSFQPVKRHALPKVKNRAWVRNPIDAFILAKLEAKGLKPSPPADRVTLLRRLSLDLTGLPPTPEEVDQFLKESADEDHLANGRMGEREKGRSGSPTLPLSHSPTLPLSTAYERQVDRLLASPHYGERWGRHWLDLARYADSNGYTIDSARTIWPYRDWVISALNRDMPFDEFTIEQLAGDLLPSATVEQKVATGFHRNTLINEEGGTDQEQFRIEAVVDRANTTGTVWLGLTVGCAQCHNHKYDPISQKEYYQFFAFFNNQEEPALSLASPEQQKLQRQVERDLAAAKKALADYDAARKPAAEAKEDPGRQKLTARVNELTERNRELARTLPSTLVLQELAKPRESTVLLRGDFLRKGAPVEPNVPAVLPPLPADVKNPSRLDLARWLVDPKNPLTARVTVNRVWQKYFGTGLVETENDFGTQGSAPSHPELLDWLAAAFTAPARLDASSTEVWKFGSIGAAPTSTPPHPPSPTLPGCGWSLKKLHRLIVTSATYRQASEVQSPKSKVQSPGSSGRLVSGGLVRTPNAEHRTPSPERLNARTPERRAAAIRNPQSLDPQNRLLWRQNRLRLDAEIVRDAALASSGLLCPKIGGPSVFPPQPDGLDAFTQNKKNWKASEGEDRYRRGMYTFHWRSLPYAMFTTFDAPNAQAACTRRTRSNTPLQALMLANDLSFVEMAQALAARTMKESSSDDERVRRAFRLCLSREPAFAESKRLLDYYRTQVRAFEADPKKAESVAPKERPQGVTLAEAAAWTAVARVLINLDEFITRE